MTENTLRALLIEDSADLARLFVEQASVFTRGRLAVEVAPTLADALALLEREAWDLVVTDLGLPDCEGYDTFARVMGGAGSAPVLVLTGRTDEALKQRILSGGGAGVVAKGLSNGRDLFDRLILFAAGPRRQPGG